MNNKILAIPAYEKAFPLAQQLNANKPIVKASIGPLRPPDGYKSEMIAGLTAIGAPAAQPLKKRSAARTPSEDGEAEAAVKAVKESMALRITFMRPTKSDMGDSCRVPKAKPNTKAVTVKVVSTVVGARSPGAPGVRSWIMDGMLADSIREDRMLKFPAMSACTFWDVI